MKSPHEYHIYHHYPPGVINNMGNPHQKSSKCVCFEKIIQLNLNDEFSGTSAFTKAQCHGSGEPWSPASTVHGGQWAKLMGVDQNNWRVYFLILKSYIGYGWIWSTCLISKHMVFIQKIIKGYWEDIHGILRWESWICRQDWVWFFVSSCGRL